MAYMKALCVGIMPIRHFFYLIYFKNFIKKKRKWQIREQLVIQIRAFFPTNPYSKIETKIIPKHDMART